MLGVIEATLESDERKNGLAPAIGYWDETEDYLAAFLASVALTSAVVDARERIKGLGRAGQDFRFWSMEIAMILGLLLAVAWFEAPKEIERRTRAGKPYAEAF